jgi:uncharacterized repeat protein (TIGR03803 family)
MRKLRFLTLALLVLTTAVAAHAQSYKVLYNMTLNGTGVWGPQWVGVFAQARDGNLYSTSQLGGTAGKGVVFRLTPLGQVTVLHSFDGATGSVPRGGLVLGSDGSLYGTTCQGGSFNNGTVFKITTAGFYAVVHNFNVNNGDGSCPETAPIQGTDGNFYGTTYAHVPGSGTVYKMTPSGLLTNLYVFNQALNRDGQRPGAIIQGADGSFYGTTQTGGVNDQGTVFKLSTAGKLTLLHSFTGSIGDGLKPVGPIIQASDGNLYGTVSDGKYFYKVTPTGVFKNFFTVTLQSGSLPDAGLIQATDGKFYVATQFWGGAGFGTILQLTTTGTPSVVHNFVYTDGGGPQVSLFQHTNGILYGDTPNGGTATQPGGVLYSLNMGLHPFVALMRTSGKAGQVIQILGNGLTGTTSVKFGSAVATFSVVSDTYMTAAVPVTATTGSVTVTAPSGIRVSSKTFKVVPVLSSFSPSGGSVGSQVVIVGTGLTQATKVTFGGVAAMVFSKSATKVTATVPTGAKTGKIAITTPGGIAMSATNFTVL